MTIQAKRARLRNGAGLAIDEVGQYFASFSLDYLVIAGGGGGGGFIGGVIVTGKQVRG